MKKKTVLTYLYAVTRAVELTVLVAARCAELSERQRERIAFLLRLSEDVTEDLKRKEK